MQNDDKMNKHLQGFTIDQFKRFIINSLYYLYNRYLMFVNNQ